MEHAPVVEADARAPVAAWRRSLLALADLVFPPFCAVCDVRLGAGRRDPLCGACWDRLDRIQPPLCVRCGVPFPRLAGTGSGDGHVCGACRRRRPRFAYARSATVYTEVVREAIHAFKFGGRRALAAPLGDLLADTARRDLPGMRVDLLVPVPLHPRRERERGFNQAELLAARLSRGFPAPVGRGVLARRVATAPQSELAAEDRQANVRDAFETRRPDAVRSRHVLLVDDLLTTGATAGACADCLRAAGAASVGVLTVARVP